ncbi:hypothetical protein DFQ28_006136 [Apophysomyces sp. BC1034]|nr:hypothetical protein DFQ30_006151 [Apophysomyces sp. BC1015]KAG0177259.1 hypothetical protein DFQ29_005058 [Apophysomyces sp. BC1021]KAG0187547.1 hypothetical protein DFQ28_006136 [Apophysomyces sp. BC1034]
MTSASTSVCTLNSSDCGAPDEDLHGSVEDRLSYNYTFVTAASPNHFCALESMLYTFREIRQYVPEKEFPRLTVYDLGLTAAQRHILENLQRHGLLDELIEFNYSAYPGFWDIKNQRGQYAWKTGAVKETQERHGGVIVWLDTGDVPNTRFVRTIPTYIRRHGFWSPRSTGLMDAKFNHDGMFEYFKETREKFAKLENCNGAALGFNADDAQIIQKLIDPWFQCGLDANCIAPPNSSRSNHRQDQSAISLLAIRAGFQCFEYPEFHGLTIHQDDRCHQRLSILNQSGELLYPSSLARPDDDLGETQFSFDGTMSTFIQPTTSPPTPTVEAHPHASYYLPPIVTTQQQQQQQQQTRENMDISNDPARINSVVADSPTEKRGTNGFHLFCAEHRPQLLEEQLTMRTLDINKILDERWQSLPQIHKKEYHQRALIINSKLDELDEDIIKSPQKRTYRKMHTDGLPTHLVSPEAILKAQQEETEEAMSRSKPRPFSAFSSFLSMKHMHEQSQQQRNDDYTQTHETVTIDGSSPPSFSIPSFSPNISKSTTPSPSLSAEAFYPDDFEEPRRSSTTCLSAKARISVATQLGAEEAEALASFDDMSKNAKKDKPPQQERIKRPPNAYLLFNRDMRRKLLEISPKMTVAEISKEIGDRWKVLPMEQRQEYIHEAMLLKQDHLRNHPDFIYTRRSKAELAEARRLSKAGRKRKSKDTAANNNTTNNDATAAVVIKTLDVSKKRPKSTPDGPRDPRGRKKKRHRHPTAPKHPMSGFLFFLAAVRPQVARHFPGSTVGPISKAIASQWREMTDEDRIPWLQKAELDKARYAREMQVYTAGQQQPDDQQSLSANDDNDDDDDIDDHTVATVAQMVNSSMSTDFVMPSPPSSSSATTTPFIHDPAALPLASNQSDSQQPLMYSNEGHVTLINVAPYAANG